LFVSYIMLNIPSGNSKITEAVDDEALTGDKVTDITKALKVGHRKAELTIEDRSQERLSAYRSDPVYPAEPAFWDWRRRRDRRCALYRLQM
jgi:hypothetical protein